MAATRRTDEHHRMARPTTADTMSYYTAIFLKLTSVRSDLEQLGLTGAAISHLAIPYLLSTKANDA